MMSIMAGVLRYAIILTILESSLVNLNIFAQASSNVSESFISSELVPDIVDTPPSSLVNVTYSSGAIVDLGNVLNVPQVLLQPSVSWDADPNQLYTLAMVDPDLPTRSNRILGEACHWLVVNIQGDNVDSGATLASYISPATPPLTGRHRYTFMVYKQSENMDTKNSTLIESLLSRVLFSIKNFAKKNNLGDPIAGNFFQGQLLGDLTGISLI